MPGKRKKKRKQLKKKRNKLKLKKKIKFKKKIKKVVKQKDKIGITALRKEKKRQDQEIQNKLEEEKINIGGLKEMNKSTKPARTILIESLIKKKQIEFTQ